MANRAEKKNKSKREYLNRMNAYFMLGISGIFLLFKIYALIFSEEGISKSDIFAFLFFTSVNTVLYKLLDALHDYPTSYFYHPLYDLLIINLLTEVLVNFYWKFWFLYLAIPAYGLYKGGIYVFNYVKTLSQPPAEGEQAYVDPNPRKLRGLK